MAPGFNATRVLILLNDHLNRAQLASSVESDNFNEVLNGGFCGGRRSLFVNCRAGADGPARRTPGSRRAALARRYPLQNIFSSYDTS